MSKYYLEVIITSMRYSLRGGNAGEGQARVDSGSFRIAAECVGGDSEAMSETQASTVPNDSVKRLERSRSDRMLAGVAGGLAKYFDIHPAVYRVGFVVLTLLGGAGIIIYIAAAMVMPKEGEEDSFASSILRARRESSLASSPASAGARRP